jgi:hypothetical protein
MSVTKLKTVGSWQPVRWDNQDIEERPTARGRVITGLLTGGEAPADAPIPEPVSFDSRGQVPQDCPSCRTPPPTNHPSTRTS